MTSSQRFDNIEQQLHELAGVPDRLIDITSFLDHIDLEEIGSLRSRVAALERGVRLFPTPSLQQQRQKEMESLENLETSAPFLCVFLFSLGLSDRSFT